MLVGDIMQAKVVSVTPRTTLFEALQVMAERGIRHLPVVDADALVGIVSDRDLKLTIVWPGRTFSAHELDETLGQVRVAEIMTHDVITTTPVSAVEEAARIMVTEKISALPVTVSGRLVGILTETDVLALFVRAMGAGEPSSRLDVMLDERRGALGNAVSVIEAAGVEVASVVTLKDRRGLREAVIRVTTIDPREAIAVLEAAGYAVRDARRGDEKLSSRRQESQGRNE